MKKLAIIDDRPSDRELVEEAMNDAISELSLSDQWGVLASEPLASADDYSPWIIDNSVDVLIIDERLFEASNGVLLSGYLGSDVVEQLRHTQKGITIIGVSADSESEGLTDKFGLFDDILAREKLIEKPTLYFQRFVRMQENFLEENASKIAELSGLSEKIATGTANTEEIERARALQEGLALPLTTPLLADRNQWLNTYKASIDNVEAVETQIRGYLEQLGQADKKDD